MADKFRSEIAGLRAIAVVSVVLFHLRIRGFDGGFVGVDVFFVISGYLITRNILADLSVGRFSLGQFYARRTRRIYPALIVTVVATYIAGALWCAPLMFLDLAKECTHALLSIANIQYWRESHHYFAPNSDELALLHFWSLSLEEQFYLVWPVFIVLVYRLGRTFAAVAMAGLVSLVGAVVVAKSDPSAVFFLMPFRIFEFAIGALVLWAELRLGRSRLASEGAAAAGVIAIIASVALFRSDMPHLEVALLIPCLGAAAMIWAGRAPRVATITANPWMIGIGAISYSLYLCHWPIIFFARFIFGADADGVAATLAQAALMLIVATAMYFWVERRFILPSHAEALSFGKTSTALALVVLPLVAITHATFLSRGFAWRLPQEEAARVHLQSFPADSDRIGLLGPVGVQFVGDSISNQYEYGLMPTFRQLNISYQGLGGAGCPIFFGAVLSRPLRRTECIAARDEALAELANSSLPVIFTQFWKTYDDASIDYDVDTRPSFSSSVGSYSKLRAALEVTVGELVRHGHRVLLVGTQLDPGCPVNLLRLQQGPLPHAPMLCPSASLEQARQMVAPTDQVLAEIQVRWPSTVSLIRPIDYFCDADCPVVKDGLWLYSNSIHLSLAGADYMMSRSERVFRDFLTSSAK
jgi:peptidoglycan/LPS O-acetylase OafA/YrhL